MKIKIIFLFVVALFVFSCEPEVELFSPSHGDADFTKYIAMGNSLTAGYADGDLYRNSQLNSYPAIIASQMKLAGLQGDFKIPLMFDELGFGKKKILDIVTDCTGKPGLSPKTAYGTPDSRNFTQTDGTGPFQNLGVPGAKVSHLLAAGYGTLNPYYGRFATNPATSSLVREYKSQNPTFFSLWIGNNDVLGYAIYGGENNPANEVITSSVAFNTYLHMVLDSLTAGGAKGVIANIPPITVCPFFTTVSPKGLTLTADNAAALNAAYHNGDWGINFAEGSNFWVIQDLAKPAPHQFRQIKANEILLLTTPGDSLKCAGWGTQKPIPHYYVLDTAEIANINAAIDAFNTIIEDAATQYNLAFVDFHAKLTQIAQNGLRIDGKGYSVKFVTGNLFSLDGIHLTGQGYAITANYFIEAINQKYKSTLPTVNPNEYPGIVFP